MAEALQTYTVTPNAGEFVAGILHGGPGTTVRLTDAQARYELLLGSIVADGTPIVVEPPAGPINALDRLDLTRGSKAWDASVGELVAFLLARILPDVSDTLGDVEGRILGDAASTDNTLGKLASRLSNISEQIQGSLQKLAAALGNDLDFAETIALAMDNRLRVDVAQGLGSEQIARAQSNLGVSSFVRTLLVKGDAAAVRATLELDTAALRPASDFASADPTLAALAALVTAADRLIYATGADAFATTALTAFARTILSGSDAAAVRGFLSLGSAALATAGSAAGNVPVLDANGKLLTSLLPALAITDIFEVASQAQMLALTAQVGDIAIRTDLNRTYALAAEPATTLANWKEMRTPTDTVLAVAGLVGTITAAQLKTALALVISDVAGLQGALDQKGTLGADVNFRDVRANRGDGTGAIYLGGGSRSLSSDGTDYLLPSGNLFVNGGRAWHDGIAAGSYSDTNAVLIQRFPSGAAIVAATVVVALDGTGRATITLPITFAQIGFAFGLNGDTNAGDFFVVLKPASASTLSATCTQAGGSAVSTTVRINYFAWGRWK